MALLRKRLTDSVESERDGFGYRFGRLVRFFLVLLAPIAALVVFLTALVLVRVRAVKWWWVALPAGLVTVVGIWSFGWSALFFTGWREAVSAAAQSSLAEWGKVVLAALGANWGRWLVAQIPLSVSLGITVGACLAGRRLLRAPEVVRDQGTKEIPYAKQVVKLEKLPLWPQPAKKPASKVPFRSEGERPWQYKELLARFGVSADGEAFDVLIAALARQMLIDGPSGAGKTTFIIEYIRGLLEAPASRHNKFPLIFLTMKPAWDITEAVAGICKRTGRKLHIVTENGRRDATTRYNPIGRGNAFEVAEYVLATEHARNPFNQTFFQEGSTTATTLAVRALFELVEKEQVYNYAGEKRVFKRDLWHLAYLHNLTILKQFKESYTETLENSLSRFLAMAEDAPVMNQFCVEMATRLSNLVESEAANVVAWDEGGLDMETAIKNGDVILFNLDPMQQPRAATSLGFYAIQELTALCAHFGLSKWGMLKDGKTRERTIFFLIDEFSALGGSQLGTLYDRSRSYGFGIGLSVQHLKTLEVIAEDFRTSVIKNANVKVLFRQDEDAETYAGLIGTQRSFKETQQTLEDVDILGSQVTASGQGSRREVNEFIISPDQLRSLRDGQAVFIVQSEQFGAERRIEIVTLRNSNPAPGKLPRALSDKQTPEQSASIAKLLGMVPDDEEAAPMPAESLEFYLTSTQCAARMTERLGNKTTAGTFQKMVLDGSAPPPAKLPGNTQKWKQTTIDAWIDTLTDTANVEPIATVQRTVDANSVSIHSLEQDWAMPAEEEAPTTQEAPDEEMTEPLY